MKAGKRSRYALAGDTWHRAAMEPGHEGREEDELTETTSPAAMGRNGARP